MKVLLSIKPEFVEKIFSGEKLYEYRKNLFKREIKVVIVYATMPVGKIVGEFEIAYILKDAPDKIWERTKKHAGISKSFFSDYFQGKSQGYAIKVASPKRYDQAIDPYQKKGKFIPPQSFRYISDKDSTI